jgi:hypothetical protein
MPLARIFTRHPERTAALSGQLQEQGYRVEVVNPNQAHLAPADLEIEFEVCERADVLDRAANLATELHADVAVAPGILQFTPKPAASPSMPIPEPVSSAAAKPEISVNAENDREREFESVFSSATDTASSQAESSEIIEIPISEPEPLPPVAFVEDVAAAKIEPIPLVEKQKERQVMPPVAFADTAKSADPVPYLSQLTPFSTPVHQEKPAEAQAELPNRSKKILEGGAGIAARVLAGAQALASSTSETVRGQMDEYKIQAEIRAAEARAAREARLLDLEQRKAEAQQRAAELEAARIEAAARLAKLVKQREPGLLPEDRNRETQPHHYSPSVPLWTPPTQKFDRAPIPAKPVKKRQPMNPQLRAVLTGAAAVTTLFIVGIALGIFHPRTPLANPANRPANAVTVQTGGVTVQTGTEKPQAQQQSAASMQDSAQIPAKPSPRVQQARHSARQAGDEADIHTSDVTVRHVAHSAVTSTPKPKQSGQQAGLKHFSDLDN